MSEPTHYNILYLIAHKKRNPRISIKAIQYKVTFIPSVVSMHGFVSLIPNVDVRNSCLNLTKRTFAMKKMSIIIDFTFFLS